jgi:cell division protein FtsN
MMINHGNKQAGGTLLGLIIGLIIGLGIAVAVAMTIKNTPFPFANKLGKQEKIVEPGAGQISDPNKPLYGNKNAAKEAAKDVVRKSDEEKAAADEKQASVKKPEPKAPELKAPDPKTNAKSDGKPPVVDKSSAEKSATDKPAADKAQKSDNADDKWIYYLQAGAFLQQADAENTKAKLALMGLSANIAERQSDNATLYRVRIGPFAQLETMNRVRSKLSDNGVDVAVVRIPK